MSGLDRILMCTRMCVAVLCMHVRVFLIIQKKHMLSEVALTLTMWMHGQVGTAYEGHAQQLHHRR